jgi:Universal stress protein family
MTSAPERRRFVTVGVEASPEAASAARYAIHKASERHLDLLIAHAYDLPTSAEAGELVVTAVISNLIVPPTMHIERLVRQASPAELLHDAEKTSELIVIGHQGIFEGQEPPPGSLIDQLAAHARTPIVTVPRVWRPGRRRLPVVVAVDGESPASNALGYAFDEATISGSELVVVHALPVPCSPRECADHEATIAEVLASWKADYPDLTVRTIISPREARQLIIDTTSMAKEVIVGHPHQSGHRAQWYWSMARSVLESSQCPLVVVPGEY